MADDKKPESTSGPGDVFLYLIGGLILIMAIGFTNGNLTRDSLRNIFFPHVNIATTTTDAAAPTN